MGLNIAKDYLVWLDAKATVQTVMLQAGMRLVLSDSQHGMVTTVFYVCCILQLTVNY